MTKIVIGTCWFRESFNTLLQFLRFVEQNASNTECQVHIAVFISRLDVDKSVSEKLHHEFKNCVVLKHDTAIFPNKNFGVAAICQYASNIGADIVSVIDSDWCNDLTSIFFTTLFSRLINGNADLIIPDNKKIVGRSNLLIGKTAVEAFYPEYNFIKSPFPGYYAGRCALLNKITSSPTYHYDWGGEWDLIRIAIEMNSNIVSISLPIHNWTMHRPNISKIFDAFQIWRAIFQGVSEERFIQFTEQTHADNTHLLRRYIRPLQSTPSSLEEIVDIYSVCPFDKTEEQMLYMVIYPILALILGEHFHLDFANNSDSPYEFSKLATISNYTVACISSLLKMYNADISKLKKTATNICGGYWSEWDESLQRKALNRIYAE